MAMQMENMGWMMAGMGLVSVLLLATLLLAIAALVKYLFTGAAGNRQDSC